MKLRGVMPHTSLAFSKWLCLAQGKSSNYLANILITSHISYTAVGNKMNYRAHVQLSMLFKWVSRANSLQHNGFPLFWVVLKTLCFQGFFFFINLLITVGVSMSFLCPLLICQVILKRKSPVLNAFFLRVAALGIALTLFCKQNFKRILMSNYFIFSWHLCGAAVLKILSSRETCIYMLMLVL